MQVNVNIPGFLITSSKPEREIIEAVVLEAYRSGKISAGKLAEVLGFSHYEADGFLKERGIISRYGMDNFIEDMETLNNIPS